MKTLLCGATFSVGQSLTPINAANIRKGAPLRPLPPACYTCRMATPIDIES
jgi:hypothetical protein